jgi:hypothetical protein
VLPDLSNIVSRNCNNIRNINELTIVKDTFANVPYPVQAHLRVNPNLFPSKTYSIQEMLNYRGTNKDREMG